jgi:hypothetical protein
MNRALLMRAQSRMPKPGGTVSERGWSKGAEVARDCGTSRVLLTEAAANCIPLSTTAVAPGAAAPPPLPPLPQAASSKVEIKRLEIERGGELIILLCTFIPSSVLKRQQGFSC